MRALPAGGVCFNCQQLFVSILGRQGAAPGSRYSCGTNTPPDDFMQHTVVGGHVLTTQTASISPTARWQNAIGSRRGVAYPKLRQSGGCTALLSVKKLSTHSMKAGRFLSLFPTRAHKPMFGKFLEAWNLFSKRFQKPRPLPKVPQKPRP